MFWFARTKFSNHVRAELLLKAHYGSHKRVHSLGISFSCQRISTLVIVAVGTPVIYSFQKDIPLIRVLGQN